MSDDDFLDDQHKHPTDYEIVLGDDGQPEGLTPPRAVENLWIVLELETGLVDGHYTSEELATRAAMYYQAGRPCHTHTVAQVSAYWGALGIVRVRDLEHAGPISDTDWAAASLRKASRRPGGEGLKFDYSSGRAAIHVPLIAGHAMIVLES